MVRATRDGLSVQLDIQEGSFHPAAARKSSRALSETEWQALATCWEGESLPWDAQPHMYGLAPVNVLIEAARKGRYRALAIHNYESDVVRECATRMLQAAGVPATELTRPPVLGFR
jgi:hypothetical protein